MRILSDEELNFLKDNLDKLSIKQLCGELGMSVNPLYRILKKNNWKKKYVLTDLEPKKRGDSKYRSWTSEEVEFLKENYSKMQAKEIAKALNRSYNAIMSMVKKLGLHKNY